MDPETAYCRSLLRTLTEEPAQFRDRLQCRWQGEEGPALGDARSWTDVLAHAYRETPEDQRGPWADVTLETLERFEGERILALVDPEELTSRLHLMGALELPWNGRATGASGYTNCSTSGFDSQRRDPIFRGRSTCTKSMGFSASRRSMCYA